MESVLKTIKKDKLFKAGDVVGVACSGGIDSICLLHYLNSIREELDIEIVAVNIDHQIRPTSADDTAFVASFCRKNRLSGDYPCGLCLGRIGLGLLRQ